MTYFLSAIVGYLIGSIPFAYILVKRRAGLDLRREGSGNIGTLNSYEVTGSKSLGGFVLLLDLLKGLVPVLVAMRIGEPISTCFLAAGLVLGHCYPLYLRFHGGRGLATAAGTFLAINPLMIFVWGAGYLVGRAIRSHVHVGNVVASLLTALVALLAPETLIAAGTVGFPAEHEFIVLERWTVTFLMAVVLSRHAEPMAEMLRGR